jgi:hypothetical protein
VYHDFGSKFSFLCQNPSGFANPKGLKTKIAKIMGEPTKLKMKTNYLLIAVLFFCQKNFAQSLQENEKTLAALGNIINQDTVPANRIAAMEKFNTLIYSTLQMKDAYKYRFDSLRSVSIQSPADSSFRLFTWQLVRSGSAFDYFGAIQMKGKKPRIVVLKDKFHDIEEREFEECTPENWCGGLIYKIKEFQGKGGKQYLLFGLNLNSENERVKFIDVLKYREGKHTFGAPIFTKQSSENRHRIVLSYSAESKVRMNFDEALQMIIFDHLVSFKHEIIGPTMVPDGDFEGYRLENGVWKYVADAVKTTPMDKAPVPTPVLDKRAKRDINGRRIRQK